MYDSLTQSRTLVFDHSAQAMSLVQNMHREVDGHTPKRYALLPPTRCNQRNSPISPKKSNMELYNIQGALSLLASGSQAYSDPQYDKRLLKNECNRAISVEMLNVSVLFEYKVRILEPLNIISLGCSIIGCQCIKIWWLMFFEEKDV